MNETHQSAGIGRPDAVGAGLLPDELDSLLRFLQHLNEPMNLEELGRCVARESRVLFRYDAFSIAVYNPATCIYEAIYAEDTRLGDTSPSPCVGRSVPLDELMTTDVYKGKSLLINRGNGPDPISLDPFGEVERRSQSLLFCAIQWQDLTLGTITVQSYESGKFNEMDVRLMESLSAQLGSVLARIRTEQALRESEAKARTLLNASSDIVLLLDRKGNILDLNETALLRLEGSREELLGTCIYRLFTPEMVDYRRRETLLVFETGKPNRISDMQAGRHYDTLICPIFDENQAVQSVAILARDVTDLRRAEEDSWRLGERLQDAHKLDSLVRLCGNISRDFHNLLVGILGGASLLRAEIPLGIPATKTIELIERSAEKATTLARQLLAYSGQSSEEPNLLNVNNLIEETRPLIEANLEGLIRLDLQLTPMIDPIRGDRLRIEQAIVELATNAAESISSGEGHIVISTRPFDHELSWFASARGNIEPLPDASYICITVADDGCGIPEEFLDRIFDPFYTSKEIGRGLGLTSVLSVVHAHNGAIHVESTPGSGTHVEIALPVAPVTDKAGDDAASSIPARFHKPSEKSRGALLIVVDEDILARVIEGMLRQSGFDLVFARSCRHARQVMAARCDTLKAAIIDLNAKRFTAEQLARDLQGEYPGFPLLLLSNYKGYKLLPTLEDWRQIRYIRKPFSPGELLRSLDDAMRSAPAGQS